MSARTKDVVSTVNSFESLCLPKRVLHDLRAHGYTRPSPIQEKAIPMVRMGGDVVIQAKAGTGKTLVFAVAAAEVIDASLQLPQVILLAPTREIALQACDVATDVAESSGYCIVTCIGGLPMSEDERVLRRGCHLVVGTPGRIKALVERKILNLRCIKLFVLDEADRLLSETFYPDVEWIMKCVPQQKQVLALSATFDGQTLQRAKCVMNPERMYEIQLSKTSTSLIGVPHYVLNRGSVEAENYQNLNQSEALEYVMGKVPFRQAIVFAQTKEEAKHTSRDISGAGYAAGFLSSDLDQLSRISILNNLRAHQLRVLVCTDIAARGIDLDHVDLVINLNISSDPSTMAHRIGRAGRFGGQGVAVTIVSNQSEESTLRHIMKECNGSEPVSFFNFTNRSTQTSLDSTAVCTRLGTLEARSCMVEEDFLGTDAFFSEYIDPILSISFFEKGSSDDILPSKDTQCGHFEMLVKSVMCDVGDRNPDDASILLSQAFSFLNEKAAEKARVHKIKRNLGSSQSNKTQSRDQKLHNTLAEEAAILESLWDASASDSTDNYNFHEALINYDER